MIKYKKGLVMNKKTFFFVAVLGSMLSFSTPIFSMYDAILTRFENDIKKKIDIEKISTDLLEIYEGFIKTMRKQPKNQSAFENLEMSIAIEKSRRQDEEAPKKREEPEQQITELSQLRHKEALGIIARGKQTNKRLIKSIFFGKGKSTLHFNKINPKED